MPDLLSALMAFVAEHQRCGDLDGSKAGWSGWSARARRGSSVRLWGLTALPILPAGSIQDLPTANDLRSAPSCA